MRLVTKVVPVSDFVHEARSRKHALLRMASDDPVERLLVQEYAEATPDPPPTAAHRGIATRGCPRCARTMWRQWETGPLWVCSRCGHLEDGEAKP
ncbi:hypothetical protein HCN56_21580 [Streptomyces lonarensis]|uniref:Uncharacterized protein n=1 Tax=Streptomyces lonarensis TaxID=700599 RepID=A0A7X6I116_9ACTN|nr:hypothetical protein [Streptomyces lonarensis]